MKTATWFQLHADRALVRVNVQEVIGKGKAARSLPGADVDIPLDQFDAKERAVLLDAFSIVAAAADADAADINEDGTLSSEIV